MWRTLTANICRTGAACILWPAPSPTTRRAIVAARTAGGYVTRATASVINSTTTNASVTPSPPQTTSSKTAKRYRERDAYELFVRPAQKQTQKNKTLKPRKKTNAKSKATGLTDKQRAAEAHAHYVIHHGAEKDAAKFLQHPRIRNVCAATLATLKGMCVDDDSCAGKWVGAGMDRSWMPTDTEALISSPPGTPTTPCAPPSQNRTKKIPPIPTWEEAAAAVFSSSSDESLASTPPPSPTTPETSLGACAVQLTAQTTPKTPSPQSATPVITQCDARDTSLMTAATFDSSIFSNSDDETMPPTPALVTLLPPQPVLTPPQPLPAITESKMPLCPNRRQTRSRTSEVRRAALDAYKVRQQRLTHETAAKTIATTISTVKKKTSKCRAKPSTRPKQVKIMTSKIPGAGFGLFLLEDVKKGEFVARYSGEAITHAENEARSGHYRIKISSNLYLDAEQKHHFEGRYINDGKRAGRQVNVRFTAGYRTNTCSNTDLRWIRIFATRNIKAGAELYLDYGDDYWQDVKANRQTRLPQPSTMTARTTPNPTSATAPSPLLSTHVSTPTPTEQKIDVFMHLAAT